MENIKFLEFDTLIVIETRENSTKYLFKHIQGHRIDISTTIKVGNYEFDVDYIMPGDQASQYRLINSNDTLVVELK